MEIHVQYVQQNNVLKLIFPWWFILTNYKTERGGVTETRGSSVL